MSLSSKFELGVTLGWGGRRRLPTAEPLGRQIGRMIFARKGRRENF